MEEVLELLKTLESQLEGKKFFGGDNIGFVDIVAVFAALWLGALLEVAGVDMLNDEKLPLLCKWIDEFNKCSVVKDTLPPRQMCLLAVRKACAIKGKEQEQAKEEAIDLLKTLEGQLKDKRFFGGDTIGLVDTVAIVTWYWVQVIQEAMGLELLTEERFPVLFRWRDDCANCSGIKESLPPRDKLLALIKDRYMPSD
ncbi:hypothetical protein RHSIM_Rhsim05G0200400 [Rhododendron simsii]|uniref:GST C-terminal domain-containing protein n=1 Tax=Rhododendron simsii TaxID=118357 RepID=A0A834GXT9_RHOSS|nr:hypothetical protein RHSIM_Rhsim05G0200400 [Rhododendron simsii]